MNRSILAAAIAAAVLAPSADAAPRVSDDPDRAAASQVIVGFAPNADRVERDRATARASAVSSERVARNVELVHLAAGASNARAIRRLEADPAVAYAEPNWLVSADATSADPYFTNGSLWGMYGDATLPANQYGSQAGEAWAAGHTGSADVYVGIIDSGVQRTHPDLDANAWSNPFEVVDGRDNDGNGYVDDAQGWDFANNDASVYDGGPRGKLDAHGTHVTGTIAAESNGTGVVGVNWNVKYIPAKFLGRAGGTTANAVKAVDYITDLKVRHGLNIVATNNSWGGGGYSQALADAIQRAGAANILFVAAAGNGGSDSIGDNTDTNPHYPSSYSSSYVIAVAALTSSGAKAGYSNYGPTSVDLGAPGSGIYSTVPFSRYDSFGGTSMATPHVTGAAALYASTHAGAGAAAIKSAILNSAVATGSLAGKTVTGGRLDVSGF